MKNIKAANSKAFLLTTVALFAVTFLAGAADPYAGSTWAFLDSAKALEAAKAITLEQYPDCDEATVEKKMVRVYRADGTGESQDDSFVKVLTEKGKRNNRTLALSFLLPYFTAEVVKLEVFKPDGSVEAVDIAANSKESIDDSQMAMNIYDPNSKILQVNIPKLDVGDVVHAVTRMTVQRSIIPGEFADLNVFEGRGYIRHMLYEVHAPADKPLKCIRLRDEVPGTVTSSSAPDGNNGTVYRWEVNNVPRMFDEPAMPPYENVLQRLLVSTSPDWPSVSKWYWELSKSHLDATTPDMKKTVDELTAGAKTEMDRIKAVFYYVSKKVRYMGLTPEKDRPGFEPHDVSLTFDKKYGVCRDKAALLVSMLRIAGLRAYPVLINVGTKMDPEVADPFFNHAIVCVDLKDRDYVLMDPTDENTRELLPSTDCDQSYLVCRPEGEDLKTSPIKPPKDNMMRVKTTAVLNNAGNIEAKSDLSFGGVNDNSYRGAFARMKPDDTRRFFERAIKRSMPGATLKSLKLTPENMLDMSSEVHAVIEFSFPNSTATGNGKAVVSVPWIGKSMGIVNYILSGTGLDKRKYPMQTFVACGLQEDVTIKLADGYTGAVSMPSCSPVDDNSLSYGEAFSFQNHTLTCSRHLTLKIVEFSPGQYLKLKGTLEALDYDARKAPVLALAPNARPQPEVASSSDPNTPVESNARILESHKELELKDAHTAVYRVKYSKRILTYSGKLREAEIKIDYNPSCQEAKLLHAVVVSKNGERQEISKGEINVMDAGWNASAKRYTGGKVLVANLPGIDIGSTIEVEYEITTRDKPFLAGFESFQFPDELERKSFELTAPAGLKVSKLVTGPSGMVTETEHSADGKQTSEWRSENVKALPAEPQLPPEWLYNAGVGWCAGDIKTYWRDLSQAMLDRSKKSAKAAAQARDLVSKCNDRLDALKAIRDFVAKSIRLAGPSFADLPLSELSDADTTLADGYGHLADRAILLHAMLSAAGFKPEFVMASGLPPMPQIKKVLKSLPMPRYFESPLVRVKVGRETYYLNDSDQYSQLGSTAHDGTLALAPANQALEVVKAAKNCEDKTDTVYTLSLTDDGKTRLRVSRHYFGGRYNSLNRFFSELPPEERRRYFQEVVSAVSQGARPVGELTTRFDQYPGLEEFTVDVDHYCVVDGKYLYFDLPFTPSLFPPGPDRRTLPLFVSRESDNTVRTEIELPAKFRQFVIKPAARRLKAPDSSGSVRIRFTESGGKCVFNHEFKTEPAIVSPKDYPAMLKLESALGNKASRLLLLEAN